MIPLPVNLALNLFGAQIVAFDVVHTRTGNGVATAAKEGDRNISGIIQPITDETVHMVPEGAELDGTKLIHTRSPVSAATSENGTTQDRQTYVRHEGVVWKLWVTNSWLPHTDIGFFVITKYVDPNGVIK